MHVRYVLVLSDGDGTMRLGGIKRNAEIQLLLDQQPQEFSEDFHRGRRRPNVNASDHPDPPGLI
jgi:hypothetical protein